MPRILAGGHFPDDFVLSVIPAMKLSLHPGINTVLPYCGHFLHWILAFNYFQNPKLTALARPPCLDFESIRVNSW